MIGLCRVSVKKTILHGFLCLFVHMWGAEELTAFVPDYLFKDVCIVNSLGR